MRHRPFWDMPSCNSLEHSIRLPIVLARSPWLPRLFSCIATLAVLAYISIPWLHAVMQPDWGEARPTLPCSGGSDAVSERDRLDETVDCRWSLGAAAQLGRFPDTRMQFSEETFFSSDTLGDATGVAPNAQAWCPRSGPGRSPPVECLSAGP